jgi:hypothetical protein
VSATNDNYGQIDTSEWHQTLVSVGAKIIINRHRYHYVRKPHLRRAHTKNGDTENAWLCRHVLYYRVIWDAHPGTSPISIYRRRAKLECVSHYNIYLSRSLRVCVTDLIANWAPYGTNTRCTRGRTSPITMKSETHFILAHHRFNCGLGSLWH